MGRQWLHAKRMVAGLKKGRNNTKIVREITVAAKMGGANPEMNPRLAAAIEKAKKESVSKDVIERAINKGSGGGDDKASLDHVVYEGYAPHKVPVIVEAYTDNVNRTNTDVRILFKTGQIGQAGSNKFLFEYVGIVDSFKEGADIEDPEAIAIEAGANDFKLITTEDNDDLSDNQKGLRLICERTDVHQVSTWLKENGWTVVTAELAYLPKQPMSLGEAERDEVGEFLQALEENDDVHRVWAALI